MAQMSKTLQCRFDVALFAQVNDGAAAAVRKLSSVGMAEPNDWHTRC
jgi:hypothetical protein